jgi:hypothetical protein
MAGDLLLVGSIPLDTPEQVFRRVGGPLASIEQAITRIEARLACVEQATIRVQARLEPNLPHLATKADFVRAEPALPQFSTKAEHTYKPSRHWLLRAAMAAAYTAAIAAGAVSALLLTYLPHH